MTHTSQEQQKRGAAQEVQRIEVETPKSSLEVLSSPHDILGKEYDFNGVSFTVLGIEPEFFDGDETAAIQDLQPGAVAIVNIQKQRIPVIPFQGGMARITKIQISEEVIVGYAEIIKHIEIVDQAPEGWMTNRGLARELKSDKETILSRAKKYRQSNSDWFRNYRFPGHSVCEHYSPELCSIIRNEITKRKQSPSGWKTNENFALELRESRTIVKKYAESYRQSHPEWFCNYAINNGGLYEHYSPQLCDAIQNYFSTKEQVPDGWMTNNKLMIQLGVSQSPIANIAFLYRQSHPKWFREYKCSTGHMRECYAPELCAIIRSEIKNIGEAPKGWMTNKGLAKKIGVGELTITNNIRSYQQSHSEWFQNYRSHGGRVREYFSSELCESICSEIDKIKRAPEGWMTKNKLAKNLNVSEPLIRKFFDAYRNNTPEWFHEYRDKGGRLFEHFSPELCAIICSEIDKIERAPEGWMTNGNLSEELSSHESAIYRQATIYADSHPEWFHDYKAQNGKIHKHYAPELCDLIRQAVNDKRS